MCVEAQPTQVALSIWESLGFRASLHLPPVPRGRTPRPGVTLRAVMVASGSAPSSPGCHSPLTFRVGGLHLSSKLQAQDPQASPTFELATELLLHAREPPSAHDSGL